ncbi:L,D-transpeptidase [Nakamurella lactea]|uniref:L,D-transpeptidase n=1 Tax=Nakamurella lactea TaxID=459515 RepID=UPI0004019872|nr:Ig-like domain-containing protein [Nakamurella lactea]
MQRIRRFAPLVALVAAVLVVAGCTATASGSADPTETAAAPAGGSTVTAGAVTSAQTSTDPNGAATGSSASVPESGTSTGSSPAPSTSSSPKPVPPVATVSSDPKVGSTGISPVEPITVSVAKGTIEDIALTNAGGYQVKGTLAADKKSWKTAEVLGFGKTYTLSGTAVGTDGKNVDISGKYTVVDPKSQVRTTISPGDGAVVGVAMPVMIIFGVEPQDRTLIEKNVKITTTPEVDGAWAWIQHDGGDWGLDYRPKGYWPAGTKVHVEANVYGLEFAAGSYGKTDLTSDFTIGRNQVVKADVNSHTMVVQRDGKTVATYPASYGQGNGNPDLTTRSGIHVVNDKFAEKRMSNPKYHYVNLLERWAVRISNNGEFIHANPQSAASQGNTNVTHGCVNLSLENAKAYYDTALIGDPVEVTGTDIQLGPSDGDIFDYAIPWSEWVTLSGLN